MVLFGPVFRTLPFVATLVHSILPSFRDCWCNGRKPSHPRHDVMHVHAFWHERPALTAVQRVHEWNMNVLMPFASSIVIARSFGSTASCEIVQPPSRFHKTRDQTCHEVSDCDLEPQFANSSFPFLSGFSFFSFLLFILFFSHHFSRPHINLSSQI